MKLINQKSVTAGEYSPRFRPATPFLIEGCIILQCINGEATFRMDLKDFRIAKDDTVILFNDMVIELGERSDDFTIRYVSVPEEQVFEIYVNIVSNAFWDTIYLSPVQHFSPRHNTAIGNWLSECMLVAGSCRKAVTDAVIPKLLLSLFTVMEDLISHSKTDAPPPFGLTPMRIVGEFFVLLCRHYTSEHKVAFYADALNITPDYLSVLTRECTGKTPKETIDGKLVLAMKALLESTDLSVKNIAYRLHYDDTSHLCKVFRRHTGLSPAEYRRRHK